MTKPLSVLVVDDEPLAAERLCALLAELPDCALAGVAGNAEQAWQYAQRLAPDVVLLDIAMPGESGLELACRLRGLPKPPAVVFCTAFGQHALQAFEADVGHRIGLGHGGDRRKRRQRQRNGGCNRCTRGSGQLHQGEGP